MCLSCVVYGLAGGRCFGRIGLCVGHIGLCAGCGWWGRRLSFRVSPLLSCLVFGWFSLLFGDLCAMVAWVWEGDSCVFSVDLGLRVGNLGDSGRSLNGSLGVLFCPRCVGTWKLGNLGIGRWFLGSNLLFP